MSEMPILEPVNSVEGPMVIDEYIKLASLMAFPDLQMRRALRFYKPPTPVPASDSQWAALLKMLKYYECQQNEGEIGQVMQLIKGKHSLLEIGSAFV